MMLSDNAVISGLHANIFRVTRSIQKRFQVTPEGEFLTLKKISTETCFENKMTKTAAKDL